MMCLIWAQKAVSKPLKKGRSNGLATRLIHSVPFAAVLLSLGLAVQAQELAPDPHCALITLIQTTQHHIMCDADDQEMRLDLTQTLSRYSQHYQRNAGVSAGAMADAINSRVNAPLPAGYSCRSGAIHSFYESLKSDRQKLQRQTDVHLRDSLPMSADFERGCWGDVLE